MIKQEFGLSDQDFSSKSREGLEPVSLQRPRTFLLIRLNSCRRSWAGKTSPWMITAASNTPPERPRRKCWKCATASSAKWRMWWFIPATKRMCKNRGLLQPGKNSDNGFQRRLFRELRLSSGPRRHLAGGQHAHEQTAGCERTESDGAGSTGNVRAGLMKTH